VIIMSKAQKPARPSFADEVDKLVHDHLNNGTPIKSVRAKTDAAELASAIALFHELLHGHRQQLIPGANSAWRAAGSLLDDLKTGLKGPVWRYIDDVRATRREPRRAAAGRAEEPLHAAVIGLIDAYRARTGRRKVTHLFIDAFTRGGWKFSVNQINDWRKKFADMPEDEYSKAMPELFRAQIEKLYPAPEDMLIRGVARVLSIARR
jgi:hypothetical protein